VRLTSLTVRHAEAGGEPADENTRDFDVQISEDGSTFRTIDRVRGNTRAVTTHAAKGPARFVRIIVLAGDRAGRGPARIYELEAYGVRRQAPATTRTCFGFPARDPMRGPHPTLPIDPDVPPLDEKYLTAARVLWQEQWPAAWQAFAPPRIAHDERQGIATVTVTTDASALLGGGSVSISYADIVDGVDRGELGGWLHDAARLLQTRYPGSGVPGLFSEGIPDFIRFAARGEDPAWRLVERRQLGAGAFDSQHVWSAGGRDGARFLLWVTQHYDSSGARYQLVHDLNTAVDSGALDYAGLFVTLTGRSYAQLFAEYAKDRVIMPHC
jgi:hypothetical protein